MMNGRDKPARLGHPVRRIKTESGREWNVEVFEVPPGYGVRTQDGVNSEYLLRFECEDVALDLSSFPSDWARRTDEELVTLLRNATTPSFVLLSLYSTDARR